MSTPCRPRSAALAFSAVLLATASALAQMTWVERTPPPSSLPGMVRHAMAYDSARGRVVRFGGGSGKTWEWDGNTWTARTPPLAPSIRSDTAMAYDPVRGRVVLFGGTRGRDETWEWDGSTWTQRTPAIRPPERSKHAMVYDAGRGRILLFGGDDPGGATLNDTWDWDGTSWTRLQPTSSPNGRFSFTMAYDTARRRGVLLQYVNSETWEWDGVDWTRRTPATSPPQRQDAAMAYDAVRGRTVLFGGRNMPNEGTWEWDGVDWTHRQPSAQPSRRHNHAMAFDGQRRRVLLFGGDGSGTVALNDTWEWDGTTWAVRTSSPSPLPSFSYLPLAYHEGLGVAVLSREGETWTWDGTGWTRHASLGPYPTSARAMVHDPVRQRIVLVGEATQSAQTWEWNGSGWSPAPSSGPARFAHAVAFDRARGVIVLFGGHLGGVNRVYPADTWEWDGAQWTRRASTGPAPRGEHAMAYDPVLRRVVLFGGHRRYGEYFDDFWAWDGSAWTRLAGGPPARSGHGLAADPDRRVVVLQGGFVGALSNLVSRGDHWEWDGAIWQQQTATGPGARSSHGMAYDTARHRVVLFGGTNFTGGGTLAIPGDTWEYHASASYTPFGSGCAGSAGTPTLAVVPERLPWLGASLAVAVQNLPPGRPAVMTLGASNTAWGAWQLPLPLGFLGMPGCTLYASGEVSYPLANPAGSATWTLAVPNLPALLSAVFYNQAYVFDPPANAPGLTTSNAGAAFVGAR